MGPEITPSTFIFAPPVGEAQQGPVEVPSYGMKFLDIIGLTHLADVEMVREQDAEPMLWRDFMGICAEHAIPVLKGLEKMNPTDPRRAEAIKTIIEMYVTPYLNPVLEPADHVNLVPKAS